MIFLITLLAFLLRLYRVDQVPPSLYWDEASLGYNAYAIAQTGRDEHGVFLPHDAFAAFGDYKPVGYIYAVVPFVKILGLTETAVRLPSVIAGTLLVLISYFLVKEISRDRRWAMIAALFVAVSPWSLQMSRAAFEANLATLLTAAGTLLFLRKSVWAAFFFAAAMYTFNSHRIFVPLLVGLLSLWHFQKKTLLLLAIFLLPLLPHLLSPEGKLRFNEVTWLNDLSLVETANKNIAANNNALWAKVVYNRRVVYAGEFARHYLDHFRFDFLFQSGDINARLSTRNFGEMYLLDLPLLIIGILVLIKRHNRVTFLLFGWLLLAPIPAAMARETPHALRTLNILPVPQIIAALGAVTLMKKLRFILVPALAVSVYFYLQNYLLVYPVRFAGDWQSGYKQMVEYVATIQKDYDYIDVTNHYGRPYIYFLFYNRYDPQKYWQNRQASKDRFGFWTVAVFDKYVFDGRPRQGKTLYVRSPGEKTGGRLVKVLDSFELYD